MNEELFPPESVASPSPRLCWMQRHRIRTIFREGMRPGFEFAAWSERSCDYTNEDEGERMECYGYVFFGETEDEALNNFCIENKIKYWNEADPL